MDTLHTRIRIALAALVALMTFGAVAPLQADGFIYVHTHDHPHVVPTPRPHRRRIPRPQFPLRVTLHHVNVGIDGGVARTQVDETFHNPNPYQLEGTYLFPLPPGASITSFAMSMNGKMVEGEVLEKDKARSIYEGIVRQMKDPGLLEYVDRGLFKARVFPIPANGDVKVRIAYEEKIRADSGFSRYHYPLDTGKYSAGDYRNVLVKVSLREAAPIRNIGSPSHPVEITRPSPTEANVIFEAATLDAKKDFVLDWNVGKDVLAPMLLTFRGSEEESFFMLSLSPDVDRAETVPPKDLVIVFDTSGSMLGPKLADAKKAVKHFVYGLNDGDRFNIVDFSSEARRFRETIVEASEENRAAAVRYVDSLKARGGTHVEDALRSAFASFPSGSDRFELVALISDGEPTLGETTVDELTTLAKRLGGGSRRIFSFGIGVEVDTHLLDRLASENRGAVDYALPGEQLEIKLSNFYDKIDQPVLTGIQVDFRSLVTRDVHPRPLPDLFRGERLVLVGRFKNPGKHTVLVRGNYLGKEQAFEHALEFQAENSPRNDFLPRLWAARQVGYMLDAMRLGGEKKELRDEVIRLSKRYGILTPYTSYLIVEDERGRAPQQTTATGPAVPELRGALRRFGRQLGGAASAGQSADVESSNADAALPSPAAAKAFRRRSGRESVKLAEELRELKDGKLESAEDSFARVAGGRRADGVDVQIREVAGTTFLFGAGGWIDTSLKVEDIEKARVVEYLSDAYFKLLEELPGIGKVLSLGDSLAVRWLGKIIVIKPSAP